jgi:para-aminobenzoate synthetase
MTEAETQPAAAAAASSVLLIDNFDSFTWNLAQLLGELCGGRAPCVVTNATPWEEVQRLIAVHSIDAIVISPGPGNPAENPADFGVCAQVLQRCSHIPTLAVCLGHQGLAHLHGGRVVRAPEPVHGRLSAVTVLGDDSTECERLFQGIPSGFSVVRYHSLVVERRTLPSSLLPLAETEDGLLMAFRVAAKPQWGVQYHPESICTEHGKTLLRNFLDIARARATHCEEEVAQPAVLHSSSPPITPPEAGDRNAGKGAQLRLLVDRLPFPGGDTAPDDLPAAAYEALFSRPSAARQQAPTAAAAAAAAAATFWLDSATASAAPGAAECDRRARFSFMGGSDGPRAHTVEYDVAARVVTVSTPLAGSRTTENLGGDEAAQSEHGLFGWLQRQLASIGEPTAIEHAVDGDSALLLPFEFHGGYVGYLGYELRHECGHSAGDDSAERSAKSTDGAPPTAALLFVDRFLAFDMEEQCVYVVSLADRTDRVAALAWIAQMKAAIVALASGEEPPPTREETNKRDAAESQHYQGGQWVNAKLARGKAQYLEDIGSSLDAIAAGETYEVCLTVGVTVDKAQAPPVLPLYTELRRSNPAPYGALLRFGGCEPGEGKGGFAVLSSSPERFLKIGTDGMIESKPIKGTVRRGVTAEEDAALSHALQTSEKERAENLMIVDLTRHDLGQVCEIGSVHVPDGKLFAVESYATVHQLVSTVRGQLPVTSDGVVADGKQVQAVAACFPPGSMTGAPKHRTMQIIDQLEQGAPRGLYAGALGFFSLNGAVDLSVVIRTLVVSDNGVHIGGGGAIVYQSTPAEEFSEVLLKLRAPLLAVARTLGKDGVDFGSQCDGERLLRLPAVGHPESAAFTTIPWDYRNAAQTERVKDEDNTVSLWRLDAYLQRLADHCARLGIVAPADGFRAEMQRALREWTPPEIPADPAAQGQGLFRVEWTASGVMNLAGRILPAIAQTKRDALSAVSVAAPWWSKSEVVGTKHGAWSPYIDAMHAAWAHGSYCAVLVDPDGTVIDGDRVTPILIDRQTTTGEGGTEQNVRLRYPPSQAGAVESMTMRALREELLSNTTRVESSGEVISIEESSFSLQDVLEAEEVLVVGSGVGVGNVTQVNGVAIAGGAKSAAAAAPTGGGTSSSADSAVTRCGDDDSGRLYGAVASCLLKARSRDWETFTRGQTTDIPTASHQ